MKLCGTRTPARQRPMRCPKRTVTASIESSKRNAIVPALQTGKTLRIIHLEEAKNERMPLDPTLKTATISDFRRDEKDTGSPEVQIAIASKRIEQLTEHLRSQPKDHASRRGLLVHVSKRRRLLDYLKKHDEPCYRSMLERLNIRK